MVTADTVLVLTCADDPTADAVLDALRHRGAPTARMDLGDFPTVLRLSATTADRGWAGRLGSGRTGVDLSEVRSVYYRRPTRFRLPEGLSPPDQAFAALEARHGLGGLLATLPALWVNDPVKTATAEYKPLQLATAARSGLRSPRTLLSNHLPDAVAFAAEVGGQVVCKQLSTMVFTGDDEVMRMTYTTRVDPADIDPAGFAATVHQLQEWVPKAFEARVTVVGRTPYGVAIHAGSDAARVDWRADYDALTYRPVDVPPAVTAGLGRFMDALGLYFGAFDFVITPDDEWIMLEVNPAGQWLWLEHEAGVPIAAALANLLADGAPR